MPVPIVEFEVFRAHLGVAADAVESDAVSRLLDAICAEARRITRLPMEGDEGGTYDQVIRIRGAREFLLPEVPVLEVTSIAPAYFDGTIGDPYDTGDWRLEDAARGSIRLRFTPEYVSVAWRTTGDIPAQLPQAVLEWGKTRWDSRDRAADLASYETGEDAESYFASLAGQPPRSVATALLGVRHARGGGPV